MSSSSDGYVYTGGSAFSLEIDTAAPQEAKAAPVAEAAEAAVVVRLHGELQINACGRLEEAVNQLLDAAPRRPVVLAMADCPYLDPGGLRVLLSLVRRTQAQGGALYLAELSPRVARDLEITRMIKGFTVSPSVEEALQAAAELRHQ